MKSLHINAVRNVRSFRGRFIFLDQEGMLGGASGAEDVVVSLRKTLNELNVERAGKAQVGESIEDISARINAISAQLGSLGGGEIDGLG